MRKYVKLIFGEEEKKKKMQVLIEEEFVTPNTSKKRKLAEKFRVEEMEEKERFEVKGRFSYLHKVPASEWSEERHLIMWREDKKEGLYLDLYDFRNLFDKSELQKFVEKERPSPSDPKLEKVRWEELEQRERYLEEETAKRKLMAKNKYSAIAFDYNLINKPTDILPLEPRDPPPQPPDENIIPPPPLNEAIPLPPPVEVFKPSFQVPPQIQIVRFLDQNFLYTLNHAFLKSQKRKSSIK